MKLSYIETTLTPLRSLNASCDGDIRHGVIIRGREGATTGYFEYTPWEELGDIPVSAYLEMVKEKEPPLYQRLIQNLKLSIELQESLDEIDFSFKNHQLVYPDQDLDSVVSPVVKIKYQNDLDQLSDAVKRLAAAGKKIRIDFNEKLSIIEFNSFINGLKDAFDSIEYIEDPIPYDRTIYRVFKERVSSKIRLDHPFNHGIMNQDFMVIYRPNVGQMGYSNINREDVFASHMGHPLGKLHCYIVLLKFGNKKLYHGIETPKIYSEDRELFSQSEDGLMLNKSEVKKLFHDLGDEKWQEL